MSLALPNTLGNIITKVRRVTARPSVNQITDQEIIRYVNTFYIYDMPEHLKMESLRVNFQFTTQANIPAYDFPRNLYLTAMPPVYIANYQSYMTQSRENFFRINPELNYLQQQVYTGNNTNSGYTGQFLINLPILPGFKRNPPGAYSTSNFPPPSQINWNLLVTGQLAADPVSGIQKYLSLVDDGQGNLFSIDDLNSNPAAKRGTINYITGAIDITNWPQPIPSGNPINAQYVPYVPSRPQSVVFYQDQILMYPIPDQAYTVSFEAYAYPAFFDFDAQGQPILNLQPQLDEWWQMLAYGASDKIFADSGDFENMQKYRPLLKEQMDLCLRRTIVQQTCERASTIYTEQTQFPQYPFGNLFTGF